MKKKGEGTKAAERVIKQLNATISKEKEAFLRAGGTGLDKLSVGASMLEAINAAQSKLQQLLKIEKR